MNKKYIVFILYALVLASIISVKLYKDRESNTKLKEMIVEQESQSLAALTVSLRNVYQKAFIDNHIKLDSNTINLLPVRTANDIAKSFSNIINKKTSIRTVSDRPRNPKNKANKNEMEIISYFKSHPEKQSFFKDIDTSYYYAVPLRIKQSCLKCHGARENTISLIRDKYSEAYDYKIGDLRGIISINMTKKEIFDNIIAKQLHTIFAAILIYLFLLALGFIVIKFITNSEKKYTEQLQLKVEETTKELKEKNERLRLEIENSSALNEELSQNMEELIATKESLAQQKEKIEQSEKKFKKIFNSSIVGISILTQDGTHIDTNPNSELIHGYSRKELIGEKFRDFSHPDDIEKSAKAVMNLLTNKSSQENLVVRLIHKNTNNIIWINASLSKYDDENILVVFQDITKQKDIDIELKEKEEKFRKIINSANDAVILIDNNENIALWNTAAHNIFGYSEKEVLGKNLHEILPLPKARDKAHNAFALFRKSGKGNAINKTVEVEAIRKDGRIIPVELSLSVLKIKGLWSAVGIVRDISIRKEYDEALKESREKIEEAVKQFEDTINNLEDVYFKTDRNFIYTLISPSIKKYLNLENLDQIIGKPLQEYWDITKDELKKLTFRILREKFIKDYIFNYKTTDQKIGYGKINGRLLYDKNNKFAGVEGIIRDVTTDVEYQNKIKELHSQKEVLINNIPSSIFYKDLNLKYLEVNKHFAKLLNKKPEEIIGKTDFELISKEEASFYEDMDKKVINSKEPVVDYIKEYKTDDLKSYWVSTSKIPYLDAKNNVAGVIGVVRDITEQIEHEKEIQESKNKIEVAHKDITDNINYAKTIQQALLPADDVIKNNINDFFVFFKPKEQVSGDFYYFKRINKYIIFAAADCTGHGVSGGFLTMLGITHLNDIVSRKNINNPAKALNLFRDKIKDTYKTFGSENKDGLDIALCALNTETNELNYSGAFNPLWIVRDGELIEYKATRNPIGFYVNEKEFVNHEIQLQKNDNIYIFSDGFADQFGGEFDKKYTAKRLKRFLVSISSYSMDKQKIKISKEFDNWIGDKEQVDDVLIMGFKI